MAKVSHRTSGEAPPCFFSNVTFRRGLRHDHFVGDAQALVDAGLVTFDQLPGQPGRGRVMTSFNADGTPRGRGCNTKGSFEEGAKKITVLPSGRYRVDWVVAAEELNRRVIDFREQEWAKNEAFKALKAASESSRDAAGAKECSTRWTASPERTQSPQTTFNVGDRCIDAINGLGALVLRGYGPCLVQSEEGEIDERLGYLVLFDGDSDAHFAAAGELFDLQNGIHHIAVVR